ncbi:MAG: tetratricopeptide repeat protein [Lysobacter sp.]|nr:MAG: tetratricopeptide repeat protein [Lysobacter sp.]
MAAVDWAASRDVVAAKNIENPQKRIGILPAVASVLAFALASQAPGVRAADAVCDRFERAPTIDTARCLREFEVKAGGNAVERLHAVVDARIKAGDFERASDALTCARALAARGDWRDRYETVRRDGVLAYRRERVPEALEAFECALGIAERNGFRPGIAKQTKNIGAGLMRLGDFRGAQTALERSLAILRADRSPEIGSTLNNLGDLYREQGDHKTALRYYEEAIENYRRAGDEIEVAHTTETLSVMALDRGDTAEAVALLTRAMREFRHEGQRPYRLRAYAGLARAAMIDGDLDAARRWSAEGLAFAAEHGLAVPSTLQLEAARIERADDRAPAAIARLSAALDELPDTDPHRIALLEQRALALADVGANAEAIAALRAAKDAERRDAQARFDRQIAWQRSRLEAAERERKIATLEHESRQRRLWTGVIALIALALALGVGLYASRRNQRAREAAAARQARYEEALQRYRSEAEALRVDRRLLRALLATRGDAVCLLDAEGQVLAANGGACALLGADEAALIGVAFAERMTPDCRERWSQAMDNTEEGRPEALRIEIESGVALDARIAQWEQDAGVLILALREASSVSSEVASSSLVDAEERRDNVIDSGVSGDADDDSERDFDSDPNADAHRRYRRNLVELMLCVIEHWERGTGTNRIELAERSRIWRIGIDDGRLRARTMERYLALAKLPDNPRWRDVLRTAYYVLEHCPIDPAPREDLQRRIYEVQAYARRDALG